MVAQPPGEAGAVGLDLDHKSGAQHLAREIGDRAHQHDTPGLEQRDAIAYALHLIEQVRGQQHRDAVGLELADQLEEFERRLRIEPGGRLVEDGDLGALDHDLGKPQPLPHAARECRHPLVGDFEQPDARAAPPRSAASAPPATSPISLAV